MRDDQRLLPPGWKWSDLVRSNDPRLTRSEAAAPVAGEAFPVGSVFLSVVTTNPATLLGYGTWAALAAGRVLVGFDSGDGDFDADKKTGGSKAVAAAGTNANESAHTHDYTDVVNHTHPVVITDPGHSHSQVATNTTTGASSVKTGGTVDTSATPDPTGTSTTGITATTSNPSGGKATGTTAGGSAHTHAFTGSATSVVQPYLTVHIWERTA